MNPFPWTRGEFPLALKQKFHTRFSNSFRGYLLIETFKTKHLGQFLFPSLELLCNLPDLIFFRSEKGLCPKAFSQKLDCNKKCQPGIADPPFFWMPSHSVFRRYLKSIITPRRTVKYVRRWAPIQQNWLQCFLIPGREIFSLVL